MSSTVLQADHGPRGNIRTPAADGNDPLGGTRSGEFEELFSTILDADFGAVARLHQALETVSAWCREHGVRGSAAELDVLAGRLADLGEELHLVREGAGDEIRFRSHRAAAATSAPAPPGPLRPLPRSR
ncbi:hypothetical protein [Streptomyces sp. cmx-4-7]|uniref:hypothetical protein n=1 Tax=Streptomyces sp. cmx-4-7 TaxID=2790939 RepID=UPI00397FFA65